MDSQDCNAGFDACKLKCATLGKQAHGIKEYLLNAVYIANLHNYVVYSKTREWTKRKLEHGATWSTLCVTKDTKKQSELTGMYGKSPISRKIQPPKI